MKYSPYTTQLTFKKKPFSVTIHPRPEDQFDVEIVGFKGSMSGEDWQALRHYLREEGYLDAAREFCEQ